MKIDVKGIVEKQKDHLKGVVKELKVKPRLCTIIVGENPASKVYVKKKKEVLESVGMKNDIIELPEDIDQDTLEGVIETTIYDDFTHGILVQLPLPKHIDAEKIINMIPKEKDVDGFNVENLGELVKGNAYIKSCTPAGVMRIIKGIDYDITGKKVLIIGRSNILGKPLAIDLINNDAIVCVTHSKAKISIENLIRDFNPSVIISCVGKQDLIDASMLTPAFCLDLIIDCAIVRTEEGLKGDFKKEDYHYLDNWDIKYTSVPGGVGVTTTAMVAENLLRCFKAQGGK